MTPSAGRERSFRLVALGDSITVGVGDTVGPDAAYGPGWAAHLATVLGIESFTNLATNGARSSDVASVQLPAALALRPRLATVLVGGNDVLRSDFDARLTLADLRHAVSALCDAGTDVVLVRLPMIGLFELGPRLVRRVMRRRIASINAAVDEVAAAVLSGDGTTPSTVSGQVVVVDAVRAIAPARAEAWHVDRVHPSPSGHRSLALSAATALTDVDPTHEAEALTARLPEAPDPPSAWQRLVWLAVAGLPWCLRRGRDFLPGLLRAVVHDLRAVRGPGRTRTRTSCAPR